ncbi:MAG: 50S ribosomal protein L10 [Bacillota bacterium]|nr:50S ribosomal protein L10 [Eubacteriales bacterium]MDI9492021.1 50S ribosomal protein L10 [Bacillota bacterium]NLV69323.1 50S ribosomal protein L10 [Clostridiales bacterium]MDD3537378.1 50S ribosomal protein L10 [Eubacteriales bacterium]MDD4286106.1 50S ribosomal protein L10 [Eubacteriales bacterium]
MSVENLKLKQAIIDEIKDKLNKAESAVVIDYLGTTVEQANAMRRKLREANVDYTVYKNTMMARAIAGTQYESLKDVLEGPSAIAISYDDAIAPARVLAGVMKEYNKMAFKAGVVEGIFYDAEGVKELSAIPSRDELIAKFMGSIQSPVGKFVRTLQAVADAKPQTGDAIAPAAAQESPEAVQETEAPAEAEAPAAE